MNGIEIHTDDILAILEGEVSVVGQDLLETTKGLLDKMMEEGPELVTLYSGVDANPEQTEVLQQYMEETYPDAEVEVHEGGQPLYYYIISAE